MLSLRPALTAMTALVVTGLLLVGCSATASPQSTTQACEVLGNDLSSSASQLTSAFSEIQTDPKAAETALSKFGATLKRSSAKVTNVKVKAASAATSAALASMDTDLKAYIKDATKTSALASSGSDVQNTLTKLSKLCTA